MQSNRTQDFSIKDTFNIEAPEALMFKGMPEDLTDVSIPRKIPNYVFRKEPLRDMIAFLTEPKEDGFFLTGNPGTGKTTLPLQIAALVNWGVELLACHGRFEFQDAIGQFQLINGQTEFVYGPLAKAMKFGRILVVNEGDRAEPSEMLGFNDVLEGKPLSIPMNGGEIIPPHADFRIIFTGNTAGCGDSTGLFQGVLQQDLAFMDRFRILEVDYPEPDVEQLILAKSTPDLTDEIIKKMVKVATTIRAVFNNDKGENGEYSHYKKLSVTLSTRTLLRWAHLTVSFRGAPNALDYAFRQAFMNRARPEEKEGVLRIAKDVFGDLWT